MTNSDEKARGSFFSRLKAGLSRTRELLSMNVGAIAKGIGPIDESVLSELEDALILSDAGVSLAAEYTGTLRAQWRKGQLKDVQALRTELRRMIEETLAPCAVPIQICKPAPFVIMVVGVNGAGKTTTIGKVAAFFKSEGYSVLLAAGDTFRAAAIGQLKVWADRAQVELVQHKEGGDSSAVAFDAVRAGLSRGSDIVIIDTAGRLHTKANLMDEIRKIVRVIGKEIPGAPHEVLLVLDATTGQNAIAQARTFGEATGVTGIALTKLDGTAKGGVVLAVTREIGVPIRFIGVGEGIEDLRPFEARGFAEALIQPGA